MTISSIPSSAAAQAPAAPKLTPAEAVEEFVAQVESNAITRILGGGTDAGGAGGVAGLLPGGAGTGTPTSTDLTALLGGSGASTSTTDLTNLAAIASAYDFARSAAALGVNPFDQLSAQPPAGSTVDTTA